jgi:DnaJ-class molecular chaperone
MCGRALKGSKEAVMTPNDPETKARMQSSDTKPNPGDEAPRGTLGTGEDVCPQCNGSGRIDGASCSNCGGRGKIIRGIGGG